METFVVLLLSKLDAVAAQRGDGLHPILRERLLGLVGDAVPRDQMSVADRSKDHASSGHDGKHELQPMPPAESQCSDHRQPSSVTVQQGRLVSSGNRTVLI
jgi:hypothetical protein